MSGAPSGRKDLYDERYSTQQMPDRQHSAFIDVCARTMASYPLPWTNIPWNVIPVKTGISFLSAVIG